MSENLFGDEGKLDRRALSRENIIFADDKPRRFAEYENDLELIFPVEQRLANKYK